MLQDSNGAWYKELCLGLVQDEQQVPVNAQNILLYPDKDVAAIRLDHPNVKQAYCPLNLETVDYKNFKIDSFGIHRGNKNRDAAPDYTIGTLDREADGYCFDHAVKPGFSSGAISLHDKPEAIGIVIQRDVKEQETHIVARSGWRTSTGNFPMRVWLAILITINRQPVRITPPVRSIARFLKWPCLSVGQKKPTNMSLTS